MNLDAQKPFSFEIGDSIEGQQAVALYEKHLNSFRNTHDINPAYERIPFSARETPRIYTARTGGAIVGTLIGGRDDRKFYAYRLMVNPEYQRQGIAMGLIQAAQRDFDEIHGNAGPFMRERTMNDDDYKKLESRLVEYYERLGFYSINHNTPEVMVWRKNEQSQGI